MAALQQISCNGDFATKTIIDFACGFGTWGHTIRSMVVQGGDKAYIIGCDIFKKFLNKNKKYNPYDDLVLCDGRYLPFQSKCANMVLCFEMIEHLDKKTGYTFIADLDDLTKDRLVLSTPNGYLEQHDIGEMQFEEHKSIWLEKDFLQEGFNVRKYGTGLNLEFIFRKLRIFDTINRIELLISRNKFIGVMIVAEKNHITKPVRPLTYFERLQLLLK